MPMLPTIEVTQAQADRLLAVFGSVAAYRAWLRQSVVFHVVESEALDRRAAARAELDEVANPPVP